MDKFKEKNPLSLRERQVLRINKHSKVSCEKHQT